jgi:phosphonate transport system substrate-binding protein
MSRTLLMGAVAYDPKVVTIWNGFRRWLRSQGFELDYVLYSNYERQVTDLLAGRVDIAWNSPLAWVRARRLADAAGVSVQAVAMRDTDRNLTSVVVVRTDSDIKSIGDLRGRIVAVGAHDSPQATLLPLSRLRRSGLAITPAATASATDRITNDDVTVRYFDIGVGLHGDHIGGERDAARALRDGKVEAACMTDQNLLVFGHEGTLPAGVTRILATTEGYDHCNMTASPTAPATLVNRFVELLGAMAYADSEVRPLLDLEGLKHWVPGRTDRYQALEKAVDEAGFYDAVGQINAADYRP